MAGVGGQAAALPVAWRRSRMSDPMLYRQSDPIPAAELEALAREVRRLRPDGRNPEPFYEARSDIVAGLLRLRGIEPGNCR